MFLSFSYFCDKCVGLKTTGSQTDAYLYLLSQRSSSSSSSSVDCFQIHFMGRSCVPDRKVGGKEKLHLSAE